jgi:geranylgeranyl diphosphate synthase type II
VKDSVELVKIIEKEIGNLTYPKFPDLLYNPIKYVMGLKGKRMRPLLVLMAHQLFDDNLERAIFPAIAIEYFHNFTLLHDDIMDNAPLRRGKLTVHEKWSSNVAILSGDVMMIQAYQLLSKVDSNSLKEVLDVFSTTAVKVCEGQQWDMDFETQKDVNLVEYIKMIKYKTAVLLAASLQIGAITSGASKDEQNHLYEFGINMGIAFQLKDDLLDVFGIPEDFGKQVGGDILANKKTFLYLKALQLGDDLTKVKLQVYYTNNDASDVKVNAVKDIFKSLNIQKHTIDMMKAHYIKAMKHLDAISSENKEPLITFSTKLMERIS